MPERDFLTEVHYRTATIEKRDKDARTVELSFSSETVVDRWWGREQLSHDDGAVQLDRLNNGGPLLLDHDTRRQIGVIERAWLDADAKKTRAIVRFSRSALGTEIFNDIEDGIRSNVSTAYEIKKVKRIADDITLATEWEPREISIVSVPADTAVGVGRSLDASASLNSNEGVITMPEPEVVEQNRSGVEVVNQTTPVVNQDHLRIAELQYMGVALGCESEMVRDFIANKKNAEDLRIAYLEQRSKQQEQLVNPAILDLSKKDRKSYSIVRAIASRTPGMGVNADFENECSREISKRLGKESRGFFVPSDIQNQRSDELVERSILGRMVDYFTGKRTAHSVGTPSTGGYLVGTDLLASSFIDILRSKLVVVALGATFLPGLVGNVLIPKQLTSATAGWVAEGSAQGQSNLTFGQVPLTPKTLHAQAEYTRLLMLQSTPGIEMLVRNDLAAVMARGIDAAVISGTASATVPGGILGASGVNVATTTSTFEKEEAVAMMTAIANDNADFENQAWLTNPTIKGALMTRAELANTIGLPLLKDNGTMIGFPLFSTTQVPAQTIIFGAWSQILIGEWGTLDIQVNPYGTNAAAGNVEIYAFQTIDAAVRYGEAFCKLTDFA